MGLTSPLHQALLPVLNKHANTKFDSVQPHSPSMQLLRIETEGAYAALVAGSPSADAQGDAIRYVSHILPAAAYILALAFNTSTSLAEWH